MVVDNIALDAIAENKAAFAVNHDTKHTWVLKFVEGSGVTQTMNVDASIFALEEALAKLPHNARFVGACHQTHSSISVSKVASQIWTDVLDRSSTAVYTGSGS